MILITKLNKILFSFVINIIIMNKKIFVTKHFLYQFLSINDITKNTQLKLTLFFYYTHNLISTYKKLLNKNKLKSLYCSFTIYSNNIYNFLYNSIFFIRYKKKISIKYILYMYLCM